MAYSYCGTQQDKTATQTAKKAFGEAIRLSERPTSKVRNPIFWLNKRHFGNREFAAVFGQPASDCRGLSRLANERSLLSDSN